MHQKSKMTIKFTKWVLNIPSRHKMYRQSPSKIYPNWDFWYANKPPGNPAFQSISVFWPKCLKILLFQSTYTFLSNIKAIKHPPITKFFHILFAQNVSTSNWVLFRSFYYTKAHLPQKNINEIIPKMHDFEFLEIEFFRCKTLE
jgi:hypothetical protein